MLYPALLRASRHADKGAAGEGAKGQKEADSSDDEATKPSSQQTSSSGTKADAQQDAAPDEGAQPTPEQLAASLKQKEEEVAALQQEVNKLTDQVKRKMAEFVNLRERTDREKKDKEKYAIQGFAKAVLDVADNLERAAAAVPTEAVADGQPADAEQLRKLLKGLLEGVSVTEKVLLNIFKQNHLQQFNPMGEKFDPNMHNALFEIPDATKEVGTVAAVTKRGYKLHDRVIRPADVGVVRAP